MSLFGSLFTGVAALNAQSQSMSIIANNIANVNTDGYKKLNASFSDLVVQTDRNAVYNSGGVRANTNYTLNQQGSLTQTENKTDLALSGNGFFVVQQNTGANQSQFFTRAGSFKLDSNGFLVNSAGYFLVGQPINANGTLGANQPIAVNTVQPKLIQTANATLALNLDATAATSAATAPSFTRTLRVFDSQGGAQDLTVQFNKTAANAWSMDVKLPGTGTATGAPVALTFNTNGSIATIGGAAAPPATGFSLTAMNFGNGTDTTQAVKFDLTGITQFSSPFDVTFANQDGVPVGGFSGVSIDNAGIVTANFTNGLTQKLAVLPVAVFSNPNALNAKSGNVYEATLASGQPNFKASGNGGAGTIASSTLEASNVDLAEEFSRMIVTQRAYSAGTKVIATSDQMLQELLNIR
ncbi:flagellar hook protein FlgE [Roseiterribacter gracilis]|uniref:Flagellar hook protein FlgE n=1 Tax=Roseiterribacter gracilis TaxID=2812848 RepID=A0A8S8XHK4_9PROT|nr:flagellar hook protein FlgE [Rhodospirillales bacterium TMPK1]